MTGRPRLLAGLGFALLLPVGCSGSGTEPSAAPTTPASATPTPSAGPREGVAAAWTIPFQAVNGVVARVGDVVVVDGENALRGLSGATGDQVWRRPLAAGVSWSVTGGGTLALTLPAAGKRESFEVLDAAIGRTRWRTPSSVIDVSVFSEVAYLLDCKTACAITSRDIRTGDILWRTPVRSRTSVVDPDSGIGQHDVEAPAVGRFVPFRWSDDEGPDWRKVGALDVRTGRPTGAYLPEHLWYTLLVGDTHVVLGGKSSHGDATCTVAIEAFDVRTAADRWKATVHSGRKANNECMRTLGPANEMTGETMVLGAGSRIAVLDARGRPQLFDLATHKTVWAGQEVGTPLAADEHSVLVRRRFDAGPLALLDARDGRRRWTAPDPGRTIEPNAVVGSRIVVVTSTVKEPPVEGRPASTVPVVIAYDVATGRQLVRYRGWLAGAGDDWLAVTYDDDKQTKLDLIKL